MRWSCGEMSLQMTSGVSWCSYESVLRLEEVVLDTGRGHLEAAPCRCLPGAG